MGGRAQPVEWGPKNQFKIQSSKFKIKEEKRNAVRVADMGALVELARMQGELPGGGEDRS